MPDERMALLREVTVAVVYMVAAVAVMVGAAMCSSAAGWIVGGILLAVWVTVVFGDSG